MSVAVFSDELLCQVMAAIGGNTTGPGDAVVNVYINHEKKFAFVEMRSVEEASDAMALDGIIFEVRRSSDYNPSLAATLGPSQPNPNLNLGPDRIFVGGLPYYFTKVQVRELLESFGPLRGFDLMKDRETGNSKGYAFCVYQDLSVTDIACAALNGIKMGDKTLTVRRANQGANQPKPEQESVLLHAQQQIALQLMYQLGALATKVVCLTQVVTEDELKDDGEYEDILEDMRQEGRKFGNLVNVAIPHLRPDGEPSTGVGKVILPPAMGNALFASLMRVEIMSPLVPPNQCNEMYEVILNCQSIILITDAILGFRKCSAWILEEARCSARTSRSYYLEEIPSMAKYP
ncbi:hypothetical protein NL676_007396 [Syzygium grande]|nr:hypothetical protein NL676_007396 [Syzygium grande]